MFNWAVFYFCLATPTMLVSVAVGLLSRRRKIAVAGAIIFLSWVMTNSILFSQDDDRTYLVYFAFDVVSAEIFAFMLLHRFSWWKLAFLVATTIQLFTHVAYWSYAPPPRRYHEILNGFYWIQMLATWAAVLVIKRRAVSAAWLGPRPIFAPAPSVIRQYQPRTVPGQPRECPLQLRMWA